eukprot:9504090-Pyramimonas_sp.AAC.2
MGCYLYRDQGAVEQTGLVHLRERGGGRGLLVNVRKNVTERSPELLTEGRLNLRIWPGTAPVLRNQHNGPCQCKAWPSQCRA